MCNLNQCIVFVNVYVTVEMLLPSRGEANGLSGSSMWSLQKEFDNNLKV